MWLLGTFASLGIGLAIGLFGGGGGILTVPVLHYLFGLAVEGATVASLVVVGVTSAIGCVMAAQRGDVALKQGLTFALPASASILAMRYGVLPAIPDSIPIFGLTLPRSSLLMGIFAIIMLLAAAAMFRASGKGDVDDGGTTATSASRHLGKILVQGALVGAVTGLVGAGGGFLIVPALRLLLGFPIKRAVGTSLLIISINAIVAVFSGVHSGVTFEWTILGVATAASIAGMFLGGHLGKKMGSRSLNQAFAWFVLILGIGVLAKEVAWLFKPS